MPDYAKRAQEILEAVKTENQQVRNFDMGTWFSPVAEQGTTLRPDATPACGTVMCVAGWAAHKAGWTLSYVGAQAIKGDDVRPVSEVGQEWLGLPDDHLFFFSNDDALIALEELAKDRSWEEIYSDYEMETGPYDPEAWRKHWAWGL